MGRVFEALRRANQSVPATGAASKVTSINDERRRVAAAKRVSSGVHDATADELALLFNNINGKPESAPTAHTEEHTGSALSGVMASRSAGATLGAVSPARAVLETSSIEISTARVEPHLVAITQPRSAYCEHFRGLRTRILHSSEKKGLQAFVISSAGVGEGKTLTTLNLAWLLAQTDGVRALVIDADLRNPCANEYLGMGERQGLSEVLAGTKTFGESLVRLNPAGLYLLPGGAPRDNVAELLSGPTFSRVLAEARRSFDYILIDAPPLGLFTDAAVLINRADAALLVVRAGKTRFAVVDKLLDQLPRERMLGVVLNRSDEDVAESDYYYERQRRYYKNADGEVTLEAATQET